MTLPTGTPWWVAIIIILAFGPPALGSKTMAAVPGWLGSYARRRREQTPEAKADLSLSAAWQRQDAEIKRLADAYDAVAEDYSELTARVDALDEKLTEMTRRFWSAIAYVRQLTAVIRRIDPDHNIPDPPDDLEAYL